MRKSILILATPMLMAAWRATGAQNAFWQQLGDTTLTRLVAEGLRGGTDVRAAEARVDAARAARRLSAFDMAPTVTAGGSALRTRQSMAQVPGLSSPLPQRDLFDVGFDAAWEIDLFGRVRRGVSAQGALADASESSLESVRVTLASEVARAYFELRGAQRQFAVATRTAELQRKTEERAERRWRIHREREKEKLRDKEREAPEEAPEPPREKSKDKARGKEAPEGETDDKPEKARSDNEKPEKAKEKLEHEKFHPHVQSALDHAVKPLTRYRCAACGFEAKQHFWQCPGCQAWDSYPARRVEEL